MGKIRDNRAREGAGRPTHLTDELSAQLCKLVSLGVPVRIACGAEGIGKTTYYRWRELGRAGKQPYAGFFEQIEIARTKAESGITLNLIAATKKDWRAAAWWLERVRPQRYGGKQTVRLEKAPADMSDEELEASIARLGYVRAETSEDET